MTISDTAIRMVGTKPNRSEEDRPTPEEQEEQTNKVRAYLDSQAPKRILKPSRSDADDSQDLETSTPPSLTTTNKNSSSQKESPIFDPPERVKYLHMLATGATLETRRPGEVDVEEEYTESEYYTAMAAVGKEHHTTGTGFINVEMDTPQGFHLSPTKEILPSRSFRSNPAMNDWEPDESLLVAAKEKKKKPMRSESMSSDS